MNLKNVGKVFTSKFVGTGPSSYKKRIYRAAVSQRLRNTDIQSVPYKTQNKDHTRINAATSKQQAATPLRWSLRIFAESLSTSSVRCFSFVRHQLRGNFVTDSLILLTSDGLCVCHFVFYGHNMAALECMH